MKRIFVALLLSSMILVCANSQVLKQQSFENIVWTGLGLPSAEHGSDNRPSFRWAGIIDTVQARVDIWKFTMDGMLSWGALMNWDGGSAFDTFGIYNTPKKQLDFLKENPGAGSPLVHDSYYLNFLAHPFEGFDAGMGTRLEWRVGPEPTTDGFAWDNLAHVVQGDLSSGAPNTGDVKGFMKYANAYAQKALAARYRYKEYFEVGIAIPSFEEANDFTLNAGVEVSPIKLLTIAIAYENMLHAGGNLYTGVGLNFTKNFKIDAWFGLDGIGYERASDTAGNKMLGSGAAVFLKFGKLPFWIRPEFGFSNYLYSHYTAAFYTGGRINWDILSNMHLGAWTSFAWGARGDTAEWDGKSGGFIFNIRPDFTFDINERHSVSAVFEYEMKVNPNDKKYDTFAFGFYWKYNRAF
ncbi:MAG: hypothetical protein K2N58_05290 [Treponemataceae bacterium]|nr:hypothetical protein [Treponemataceae bacterium]